MTDTMTDEELIAALRRRADEVEALSNKDAPTNTAAWKIEANASLEKACRDNRAAADRLEALSPSRLSANEGVAVKPLEWEGDGHWSHGPDEGWMEEANTAFDWGYSIEFGREGKFKADSSFGWSQDGFETPDEAKAAAQADYERRILAALSTKPEAVKGEPIPDSVYYGIDGNNFYDAKTNKGMGWDFWNKWRHRLNEFPNQPPTPASGEQMKGDDAIHELYLDALAEAEKAMRKFPQPNYVISKVAEEAGEVVKAAIHCAEGRETHAALVGEIKQAMAMLIRLYIEGDQVHGLSSPLAALQQKGGSPMSRTGIPNIIRRRYEGRIVYEGRWKEKGKTRYTSRYNCPLKAEKALLERMSPERREARVSAFGLEW